MLALTVLLGIAVDASAMQTQVPRPPGGSGQEGVDGGAGGNATIRTDGEIHVIRRQAPEPPRPPQPPWQPPGGGWPGGGGGGAGAMRVPAPPNVIPTVDTTHMLYH